MSKFGVVVFPGSNCDMDAYHALKDVLGVNTETIWHQDKDININSFSGIILPGGFSYGDYLRCGAVARFSPVMQAVAQFANDGGLVIGICNGFQILCEAGLLPGALVRNNGLKFICKPVHLRVENDKTPYTGMLKAGQVLTIPIAHGEGRYVCDEETLGRLRADNRIIFRYCSPDGEISDEWNPNGSMDNIAGIASENFNVLGMMPHPERACELLLGSTDGKAILESFIKSKAA